MKVVRFKKPEDNITFDELRQLLEENKGILIFKNPHSFPDPSWCQWNFVKVSPGFASKDISERTFCWVGLQFNSGKDNYLHPFLSIDELIDLLKETGDIHWFERWEDALSFILKGRSYFPYQRISELNKNQD